MMHEIEDLSEHESSVDDTPQDPFRYMFSGIPDGDHLYEQFLLNDDDYEVNAQRAHGPRLTYLFRWCFTLVLHIL